MTAVVRRGGPRRQFDTGLGRRLEAESILRRAVKIKGDKASTFLHLGQALNALGRRKAAAAALRKALALTKRR